MAAKQNTIVDLLESEPRQAAQQHCSEERVGQPRSLSVFAYSDSCDSKLLRLIASAFNAMPMALEIALSNGFGSGGINTSGSSRAGRVFDQIFASRFPAVDAATRIRVQ